MAVSEVTLTLPESQVIELANKLSPEGNKAILRTLIPEMDRFENLVDYGDQRMRALRKQRGIHWDKLSEAEREHVVERLLHE